MDYHRSARAFPCLVILCVIGCGQAAGPETVSVTGVVTFGGDPVEGAVVVLTPANQTEDSQQAAQGETDVDGQFEIQTYVKATSSYQAGIAPGEYRVTVTKMAIPEDMRGQPKHLLPKKYRSTSTTPLSANVVAGEELVLDFTLEKK